MAEITDRLREYADHLVDNVALAMSINEGKGALVYVETLQEFATKFPEINSYAKDRAERLGLRGLL